MFQKLVAIEPVSLVPSAEKALYSFAGQVVMYPDIPANDDEIIVRIGDADAVLLSYTSRINRYVLECCPNVKYIGMCCSLYSPESANVDIRYANERGITVTGIRASVGPENMQVSIQSTPGFVGDTQRVEIKNDQVHAVVDIYSATSDIAGWSVVSTLINIASPIVF